MSRASKNISTSTAKMHRRDAEPAVNSFCTTETLSTQRICFVFEPPKNPCALSSLRLSGEAILTTLP